MNSKKKEWYFRTHDGKVYGPADIASLVEWARDGRIEPTGFVSRDRISWAPAQTMSELGMTWLIETKPGEVFGPFNREVVIRLFKEGGVPEGAKAYRLHEFPVDEDPPPVEKIVEKIVEVPVEKIVEKIVEVPPPPRTTLVVPEVVEAIDVQPPRRMTSGIFRGVDIAKLAALEGAAQRELAAAGRTGFGSIFGRKKT